ncbi:dipeptidase [Anaerosphaera multitolerans]|uniref:Membrane dipeptidase n=1 Tax=Anaerosphaera multitolerans TaxID=2487351 RepID=A0A437S5C6_9FIRM|nr:membrane dipeptidase [Anaerosphaera multitolerans]RVU54235.1 membrane dipeptidase [Anaerosphaera multitolerans]
MRIFNTHSDILTDIQYRRLKGEKNVFRNNHLGNFSKGGVNGAIFAIWVDEIHQNNYLDWVEGALFALDEELKEQKDIIKQFLTFKDYKNAIEENKIAILLGMEGLAHIGEDISLLEKYYYENGLRHASLTWNEENLLAKGPKYSGGLSSYGKKAIKKMQELGIIVDVSHLNDDGFWDLMKITEGPVMASHSNARALSSHKRNLTDEMLRELKSNGGIVGLNAASDFISDDKSKQDLKHLVVQLEYLVDIMGIDQVCFGFDFMDFLPLESLGSIVPEEGSTPTPKDFLSEADIPKILNLMEDRGFNKDEIEKISYKNIEGFLEKILK